MHVHRGLQINALFFGTYCGSGAVFVSAVRFLFADAVSPFSLSLAPSWRN